jgi:AcrR family transcriptional regulator
MEEAALQLYEAQGLANTTGAEIAAAAGVTERTFFRHFRDKLEAAFGDETRLRDTAATAVATAPASMSALATAEHALSVIAGDFDCRRDSILRRARVVEANPELREREMSRAAEWATVMARGLVARGVDERRAVMVAGVGLSLFRTAYERWAQDRTANLTTELQEVFADFRAEAAALA